MVRISWVGLFLVLSWGLCAQLAPGKYWVEFTDKQNTPFSLDNASEYLGDRAIQRRVIQNIPLQITDLPVDPNYISQVLSLGEMELINTSKWFNAIVVAPVDSTVMEEVALLPFVGAVRSAVSMGHAESPRLSDHSSVVSRDFEQYGASLNQISMLNGHLLHESGFTGEGIRIGVMDGGFAGADEMDAFQPLITAGRLVGTYDFVNGQEDVFHSSSHGTLVWSTMASFWPDSIIGSAHQAEYMLFLTENVFSEYQLEEINWVAAAEMADSAGVDVLNTSLSYTTFDDSTQSYTYADMDGESTYISRAGNIAARKGMLVINSAGNSGSPSNPWQYVGAPADADSVLAIGAVGPDSSYATFSSRGPSFDGRVKPNVCAQGSQTILAFSNNTVNPGNGTSFSSPVLTGLAACLWQTNPQATNMQVFSAIEQSAHLYNNPNDTLGFGLPNFFVAQIILNDLVLNSIDSVSSGMVINAFPNPFFDDRIELLVSDGNGGTADCRIFDIRGREVYAQSFNVESGRSVIDLSDAFSDWSIGVYLVQLEMNGQKDLVKVQKGR